MYDDVADIIDDIISVYDSTDEAAVHNATTRRLRILHYLQRGAEELWYHRSWPFTMASATLNMAAGKASVPTDFARVSYEGMLIGPDGKPWTEINWQDMLYFRERTLEQSRHYFAVTDEILTPNVGSSETFTLLYQKVTPTLTDGGQSGDPTGFPQPFGEALMLSGVVKLKSDEGDARETWRADYLKALARATALWTRASRASRMPMTVGGMW